MTDPLDDVWASRDYPVLREITRRMDAEPDPLDPHDDIAAPLGIGPGTVQSALHALRRRGLIEVQTAGSAGGDNPVIAVMDVSARAYFLTGLHPDSDDALSGLIELLRQAADRVDDEDERSRLRRAADGLTGVSRDVMVGVLTAYATKYGVH